PHLVLPAPPSYIYNPPLHDALPICDAHKKEAAMIRALFAALTMSLLFATPAAAAAKSGRIVCGAVHTPRYFGTEMLDTTIGFRKDRKSTRLNSSHDQI